MTSLSWDKNNLKFLRKLDKPERVRILKKINLILQNPKHYLEPLVNIDSYKLRIGDYRLFVDFFKEELIVRSIKHRKNAYKK